MNLKEHLEFVNSDEYQICDEVIYEISKDGICIFNPQCNNFIRALGLDKEKADSICSIINFGESYNYSSQFFELLKQTDFSIIEINEFITQIKDEYANQFINAIKTYPRFDKLDNESQIEIKQKISNKLVSKLLGINTRKYYINDIYLHSFIMPSNKFDLIKDFVSNSSEELINQILFGYCNIKAFAIDPIIEQDKAEIFDSLVKIGVCKKGKDIPIEEIFNSLNLDEIKKLLGEKRPKGKSKKSDLVEFIINMPNVFDLLEQISQIDNYYFFINDGEPKDFSKIELHEYVLSLKGYYDLFYTLIR